MRVLVTQGILSCNSVAYVVWQVAFTEIGIIAKPGLLSEVNQIQRLFSDIGSGQAMATVENHTIRHDWHRVKQARAPLSVGSKHPFKGGKKRIFTAFATSIRLCEPVE